MWRFEVRRQGWDQRRDKEKHSSQRGRGREEEEGGNERGEREQEKWWAERKRGREREGERSEEHTSELQSR